MASTTAASSDAPSHCHHVEGGGGAHGHTPAPPPPTPSNHVAARSLSVDADAAFSRFLQFRITPSLPSSFSKHPRLSPIPSPSSSDPPPHPSPPPLISLLEHRPDLLSAAADLRAFGPEYQMENRSFATGHRCDCGPRAASSVGMTGRRRDAEAELNLQPGFRFHPTDEELVVHYLCRKVSCQRLPVPIIAEVDLYKYDPWDLPEKALFGQREWYFFTLRDRKYPNGSRPNREEGRWRTARSSWVELSRRKPREKKPVGSARRGWNSELQSTMSRGWSKSLSGSVWPLRTPRLQPKLLMLNTSHQAERGWKHLRPCSHGWEEGFQSSRGLKR